MTSWRVVRLLPRVGQPAHTWHINGRADKKELGDALVADNASPGSRTVAKKRSYAAVDEQTGCGVVANAHLPHLLRRARKGSTCA